MKVQAYDLMATWAACAMALHNVPNPSLIMIMFSLACRLTVVNGLGLNTHLFNSRTFTLVNKLLETSEGYKSHEQTWSTKVRIGLEPPITSVFIVSQIRLSRGLGEFARPFGTLRNIVEICPVLRRVGATPFLS